MKRRTLGLVIAILIAVFTMTASAVTMYAADGRTRETLDNEVEAYKKVGWYEGVTMYAQDGRTIIISPFDVDAYKAVGWYEPITMYAADGRTINVNPFQVDAWKQVGWYTPITMYAQDGRTAEVNPFKIDAWKQVGWYLEPQVNLNTVILTDTIYVSSNNIQLVQDKTEAITVTFVADIYDSISYEIDDTYVLSCAWDDGWNGNDTQLYITAKNGGSTSIRIFVTDAPDIYTTINVTVPTPADLSTLSIEGIGSEFVDKQFNTNKLHSATYSIEDSYDNNVNIKVDLIASCTEHVGSSNYIKIRYHLYNSKGVVANTGTTLVEFTSTDTQYASGLTFYGLPADEYRLVFSSDLVTETQNGTQIVSKGQVKGQITWQYNKFIGTRGDNGAKVLLIPVNDTVKTFDNHEAAMFLTGTYDSGIMVTKCDGYGNFDFGDDVPTGKYIVLIVSKNTNSMERLLDENSWISYFKDLYGGSFSNEDLEKLILFVGYQKYAFDYITVAENKVINISHDFGYTAA